MEEKGEGKAAPEPQRGRQRPPPDVFFSTRVDFFFCVCCQFSFRRMDHFANQRETQQTSADNVLWLFYWFFGQGSTETSSAHLLRRNLQNREKIRQSQESSVDFQQFPQRKPIECSQKKTKKKIAKIDARRVTERNWRHSTAKARANWNNHNNN